MAEQKLYFWDRLLAVTIFKIVPKFIKPNHITILRLILIPAVLFLLWFEKYFSGLLLFLFTAFTDTLDGSLARTRNQITKWGKIYDPLADKVFICLVIAVLVIRHVDFWSMTVIVALEILIIAAAIVKNRRGLEIQANFWGKIKMNLQVLGVAALLLSLILQSASLAHFSNGTFYVAIAFAVLSLFTYSI